VSNRVLIVDCDSAAAAATAQSLRAAGYLLDLSDSFEDAIGQIGRRCPDLLITAVRLGQFNGFHLVIRCRSQHPSMPIVLTGDPGEAGLDGEAAQYGVRFLDKATEPQRFVRLIDELLAGPAPA
jgi:DNA-binding NtrC family response regulator